MYEIFSKGSSVKENGTKTSFPSSEKIELWKESELKRYEILERPIRNLFENDMEHDRFVQDLLKGLGLTKNIFGNGEENYILNGCSVERTSVGGSNYYTITPGIFLYDGNILQIYPTCYIASRQLEKEAGLATENGMEYITITYENGKFNAYIKVYSMPVEHKITDVDRGVSLIYSIKDYLNGKHFSFNHAHEITPTKINIASSIEAFQLEPVFKYVSGTKYIKYKGGKIQVESTEGSDFIFGSFTSTTATPNANIKWKGIGTGSLRNEAVTNDKLANMANLRIKGRIAGTEGSPQDITQTDLETYFKVVTTNKDRQEIITTKIFTANQEISNNTNLIFKNNTGDYGWNIKNNSSNVLEIIKGGAIPSVLASINGDGIFKAVNFETDGSYTLNNLNVEKFNYHTIDNNDTPDTATKDSMMFWKSSGSHSFKKTSFKNLPTATYNGTTPANSFNGLMDSDFIRRTIRLEACTGAGSGTGDASILASTVNSQLPNGAGGNITIDSSHIYLSGSSGETISARLTSNNTDISDLLNNIATQVPNREGVFTSDNHVIISVKNSRPVWGKITDSQIDGQISQVKSSGSVSTNGDFLIPFWNSTQTALHHYNDIVYNPSTRTLTAETVTSRSSITLKKDIRDFNNSAFDTLNKINIVSFHFKDDESQADRVGFIAEDSPALVSGIERNKMDINNCIGLLIKAVQELKEENKELRNELKYIRNFG